MRKLAYFLTFFALAVLLSAASVSAVFPSDSWFGYSVGNLPQSSYASQGQGQSQDSYGFNLGAQQSTQESSFINENDFLNAMLSGGFDYTDQQYAFGQDFGGSASQSFYGQGGFGNNGVEHVVYTKRFGVDKHGRNGWETHEITREGIPYATYNFDNRQAQNYNIYDQGSQRQMGGNLYYGTQENSGSQRSEQNSYDNSLQTSWDGRRATGFSINLNKYF